MNCLMTFVRSLLAHNCVQRQLDNFTGNSSGISNRDIFSSLKAPRRICCPRSQEISSFINFFLYSLRRFINKSLYLKIDIPE